MSGKKEKIIKLMSDSEEINKIGRLHKLKKICEHSHYIDIVVRRNGQDEHFEGDFLKQVIQDLTQ